MPIVFRCNCRQKIQVSRRKAGTSVQCPKCNNLVAVPVVQVYETQILDPHHTDSPTAHNPPNQLASPPPASVHGQIKLDPEPAFNFKPLLLIAIGVALLLVTAGLAAMIVIGLSGSTGSGSIANQSDTYGGPATSNSTSSVTESTASNDPFGRDSYTNTRTPQESNSTTTNSDTDLAATNRNTNPPSRLSNSAQRPSAATSSSNRNQTTKSPDHDSNEANPLSGTASNSDTNADSGLLSVLKESVFGTAVADERRDNTTTKVSQDFGFDCFPAELRAVYTLRFDKRNKDLDSEQFNEKIKSIAHTSGVPPKNIKTLCYGEMSPKNGTALLATSRTDALPHLAVLKTIEEVQSLSSRGKEKVIAGATIRQLENGTAVGLVDKNTVVIGSLNEVLFALRFHGSITHRPKFDWVDYLKYDSVQIHGNWIANLSNRRATAYTHDGTFHLHRVGNTALAELMATESNAKLQLIRGEINAQRYADIIRAAYKDSGISQPFNFTEKILIKTAQAIVNQHAYLQNNPNQEWGGQFSAVSWNEGPILVTHIKWNLKLGTLAFQNAILEPLFFAKMHSLRNSDSGLDFSTKALSEARNSMQAFETFGFETKDKRDKLESSIVHNIRVGASSYSKNTIQKFSQLEFLLTNTSSESVRSVIINRISKSVSAEAIRLAGIEADQFDLSTIEPRSRGDSNEDDLPSFLKAKKGSPSNNQWAENLLLTCGYYLKNGGDPTTAIAACRIIEDLNASEYESLLQKVAADESRVSKVRESAKRAIKVISDFNYKAPNRIPTPENSEVALEWLKSSSRPQKKGALAWFYNNPLPPESADSIVQAMLIVIDEATLGEAALMTLTKRMSPEQTHFLQKIVENALDTKSDFRMRQEYSIFRVIRLAGHFKDINTITRASMLDKHQEMAFKEINERGLDASLAIAAHLELLNQRIDKPGSRILPFRLLATLDFDESDKARVRDWAKQYVPKAPTVTRICDLLDQVDVLRKDMLPTLVLLLSKGETSDEIKKYLLQYGTAIEPMMLTALKDRESSYVSPNICQTLTQIGTQKSIEYLNFHSVSAKDNDRERYESTIEKIQRAERKPVNLDSFPDPRNQSN